MNFNVFYWRSLKTRVTLFTLLIFVLSIWSLAFYVSQMLHEDMQHLLGEQQFSTASTLAEEVSQEMADRLISLEQVATRISPGVLGNTAVMQAFLEDRPALQGMFNGGIFVTGADGTATASLPLALGRSGVNYMFRDHIAAALKEGRSAISKAVIGKMLKAPVFSLAAPIHGPQGQIIGALVGVINLSAASFLDRITKHRYGKTGDYFLVSPNDRLSMTSSNNTNLQALPAPGISPGLDRFISGYEGTTILVNPAGVEVLISAKQIAATGWLVLVSLPTEEAFAPIRNMLQRTLLATILLTLLAGSLTRWMLRRQLAPMLTAAKMLAKSSRTDQPPQTLAITRHDEIGELIGGFNRLLKTLGKREEALRLSEENLAITLQSIGDGVIATDASGQITRLNASAERLTGWTRADAIGRPLPEVFHIVDAQTRALADNPVQLVMAQGEVKGLASHTALLARDGHEYRISNSAAPIREPGGAIRGVVLVFRDVTETYRAQHALATTASLLEHTGEIAKIGGWKLDFASMTMFWSLETCRIHEIGSTVAPPLEQAFDFYTPDTRPVIQAAVRAGIEQGTPWDLELPMVTAKGHSIWARVQGMVMMQDDKAVGLIGAFQDVTLRRQAKEALQSSLRDKEALLKEVHHRVKNNLQVINSLLRLESGRSAHPETRLVLDDMQWRIRSMAVLHELLYRSGTFAAVDLGAYLKQLSTQAFRSLVAQTGAVQLKLELASVEVGMDQATPCGLLVNELISNCLKHGFPGGRAGEVRIELHALDGGAQLCLRVSDTGVGLPDDFEARRSNSLGLQLASDLARQLGGKLELAPEPGAVFVVTFAVDESKSSALAA